MQPEQRLHHTCATLSRVKKVWLHLAALEVGKNPKGKDRIVTRIVAEMTAGMTAEMNRAVPPVGKMAKVETVAVEVKVLVMVEVTPIFLLLELPGPVGLLSRMMGKAVNKVKPGHRVPDPVNLKSNKKSTGGRDPPTRAEKPKRNRRRNPSPKPVSPATVPSAIASRVTSLESTRPQLRHRELPKNPQESSARLHRFDSASQNAPPSSKDSTKTTLAKPATWNTTWTKTARPTIAPAIATTQITTTEIICQPRTPVDDVENPFTVPANELSRIISDLRSRIKSRPANQTKPSKVSRLLKETAGPSLNLSLPEGGRVENAEPENHKPSTVGMLENNVNPIVDKLQQEVANRAEQESHALINLNSVVKSNALPYPPPSAGNPGAVGTLLAKPQRPSPSTPTEPRGPVSQNKSAPQAPEPVPKLAPLVLEPWRRDPASLDMTIYRKKMADLYQKVCATSCLNAAMSIH